MICSFQLGCCLPQGYPFTHRPLHHGWTWCGLFPNRQLLESSHSTYNKEGLILQPESLTHSFIRQHVLSNYCTGATLLGGRDVTAYRTTGHQYQVSTRWQQDPQIQPVLRTSVLTHGLVRNAVRQTLITWEKNMYCNVHSYSNEEKVNDLWTRIGSTEGFLH